MNSTELYLNSIITGDKSPAVHYILFDKKQIIKEFRAGFADISGNKPLSLKTTFQAYSVTKTFTAAAVLQLAEEKIIEIEQPVKNYLPDFPYSSLITIKQLLTHSAGIPNPIPLSWIHLATEHQNFDRKRFFSRILSKNARTKTKPNEKFSYSNLGYIILGQLVEKVTNQSYEDYITTHVINKLGIKEDNLCFEIPQIEFYAKGYHKNFSFTNLILGFFINKSKYMGPAEGKWKPFYPFYVNGTSYGGLVGTPAAFVKYVQHLLTPGSHLLSDSFKNILFTENVTNDGKPTGMCLSWFTGKLSGNTYFAHAGGGGGYYCEIRLYPAKSIGSVIFFNRTGMTDERFLNTVDKFYFQEQIN